MRHRGRIPCVKTYRILTLALLGLSASLSASAQLATLPLWPNGTPEPMSFSGPEKDITQPTDRLVAGRPFVHLSNISQPSLAVYKPAAAKDTGAAVLVFPGGGYRMVAIGLEGTEVCDWLNSIGVTCVLVKYRVPIYSPDGKTTQHFPERTEDIEDAQQAMRITPRTRRRVEDRPGAHRRAWFFRRRASGGRAEQPLRLPLQGRERRRRLPQHAAELRHHDLSRLPDRCRADQTRARDHAHRQHARRPSWCRPRTTPSTKRTFFFTLRV